MEDNKKAGIGVKIFTFNEAYVPPTYKYNKSAGFIEWGVKNAYPSYILNLYNNFGSATHKSVINRKVKMIAGQGFQTIESEQLNAFVDATLLEKQMKKAALDFELFNGFALEVIWDNGGVNITSIKHIPIHKLRLGIENDEVNFPHVWFSNDWKQMKKEGFIPEAIKTFDPEDRKGKQIYLYTEYNPITDELYPIPGYSTSMNWIETDYEISKFHLNQIKQGYSPSFILNFATGIPLEEEQDAFFKQFKREYSGAEGAGKIILTYSEGQEQAPELQKIDLNDSDKRFNLLKEQIKDEIIMGHEIPPQLLLSVAGKLGSNDEREKLMEEFQLAYIEARQNQMEEVINLILSVGGYEEELVMLTYKGEITEEEVAVDDTQAEAQSNLRGSVGGVQALLQIQASVAAGTTSRSSAVAALELLYGFSPVEAEALLGDVQEGQAPADDINEEII